MKREIEGFLRSSPAEQDDKLPLKHGRCAWVANGKQCGFPGSNTLSTLGTDKWYCRFHFQCEDGFIGAQIVDQSQSYSPAKYDELYAKKEAA